MDAPRPVDGAAFVFTAGRLWDEGKNLAALDRAAVRLTAPVLAAGPLHGPHGAGIHLEHVRALDRLSAAEIARRLAAAPVFVSMARYEPFGLAVLEAAQAGAPLVLSDILTFRELWNGAAAFVPLEDDAALAAALQSLLDDPVARRRLGAAARERSGRYSVDAMVAGMLDLYHALRPPVAARSHGAAA
jgi:glycosyltransferase involved in cell wall biosynthesis